MAFDVSDAHMTRHGLGEALRGGTATAEITARAILPEILAALDGLTQRTNDACSSIEMVLSRAGIDWSTEPCAPSTEIKPSHALANIEVAFRFGTDQVVRLESLARALQRLA